MRWPHFDLFLGLCLDPAAQDSAAREREGVRLVAVFYDGEFKVAVEWRSCDGLPHHGIESGNLAYRIDLGQASPVYGGRRRASGLERGWDVGDPMEFRVRGNLCSRMHTGGQLR